MENTTKYISLDLVDAPKIAMRTNVDGDDMEDLTASMREIGLLEPIVVRAVGERYEVIAGHRRTRAAKHLRWPVIEAKILVANDDEVFVMRLAENLSRHDVDPVDEATFIGEIMLEKKMEATQVAALLKRRVEWVEERLEVFGMPDYLQAFVKQKRIPLGAALWINRIGNENTRLHYAHWAGQHGASVRGAKYWYDMWKARPDSSTFDLEKVTVEGENIPREKPTVTCSACGKPCLMEIAQNVWIHPNLSCPLEEVPRG